MGRRKRVVCVLLFLVLALASAAPARAADYYFTLYTNAGLRLDMYINYSGSSGPIYTVNGFVYATQAAPKNVPVTGTVILEDGSTARFGLTLQQAVTGYYPVGWEFTCNISTWVCSGGYAVYLAPESRGNFTLSSVSPIKPETSPERIAEALKSIGYVK